MTEHKVVCPFCQRGEVYAEGTGKVAVTLDTEALGRVAAEFDVTSNRISGMVVYK